MTTSFHDQIAAAQGAIQTVNDAIAYLNQYRDNATAEIAEGRGLTGSRSLDRLTAACKSAAAVGLMGVDADGCTRSTPARSHG